VTGKGIDDLKYAMADKLDEIRAAGATTAAADPSED